MKETEAVSQDTTTDEYNWPLCTNGDSHTIKKLLISQIIPREKLVDLATRLHRARDEQGVYQFCHTKPDEFTEIYNLQRLNRPRVRKLALSALGLGSSFRYSPTFGVV